MRKARQGKLWNDETDGGQQSAATALRHALWHLSTGCSLTRPIGCRRFGDMIFCDRNRVVLDASVAELVGAAKGLHPW